MRSVLLVLAAMAITACEAADLQTPNAQEDVPMSDAPRLTIERLYESPSLSGPKPMGVQFSPNGKRLTFLRGKADNGAQLDLWQFDVATGEPSLLVDSARLAPDEGALSEEEKALRERKRIAAFSGIVSYQWGTADTILVPIAGDLHLVTIGSDKDASGNVSIRQLTDTDAFEYDAKVSPNGRFVSFIREESVWAINLETGKEERLSPEADPNAAIRYGVAEFVAQEEMGRYTGYWWSTDDRYLAFTRVDESTVDIVPRYEISAGETAVVEQRYPRAGRPNAVVDLFVRDMETGEISEVPWRREDWGPATDQYLVRVHWAIDPYMGDDVPRMSSLVIERVGRDQTELELAVWFSGTVLTAGQNTEVFDQVRRFGVETQSNWINLNHDFRAHNGETYFWSTEETGYRHIVSTSENHVWNAVTSGDWAVAKIEAITDQTVFFTGYKDTPLERNLYSVPITGGEPERITAHGQSWMITMAPDGESFVGTSSSPTQPPQTGLYRADGTLVAWIEQNALNDDHPYTPFLEAHTVPEYGTLTAEDGQTLYYSIQTPPDFDPGRRYPAIIEVYGGPGVQTVTRDWERMNDQFYTHQGYIVFRLDNRGTANRGKVFEDTIYRQMGIPEVRDQLLGAAWLKAQPFVDPDRIAIQGWSYGGYMTLMTVLQAPPGTFAAAVSGAPVTDWSLYDTFYTERFMDTPHENPNGYQKSSVFYHLDRWKGALPPLLLVHGMADDNVTFDNTTRLIAALQEAGHPFDLMTYPGQRHGIQDVSLRQHLMRTRMRFLDRNLKTPKEE
ncbi:MAG: S9 family peptidase [Pseudomonadota bacterium]